MTPHDVQRDFALQVLLQAIRLTHSGRRKAAIELGFRPDQLDRLVRLPVESLVELAACAKTKLIALAVDAEALNAAFIVLDRRRKENALKDQLILAGASYTVMHELFAFDTVDYAEARKRLGLSEHAGGRPARPEPACHGRIWALWQRETGSVPERLLAIHRATGVEIRAIWRLIVAWDAGEPPPDVDPADAVT